MGGDGAAISVAYLAEDSALSWNFIKVHGESCSAPAAATTCQPATRLYPPDPFSCFDWLRPKLAAG